MRDENSAAKEEDFDADVDRDAHDERAALLRR